MMQKKIPHYVYIIIFVVLCALDRITKLGALAYLQDCTYEITENCACVLEFNRGVAWGMFSFGDTFIFALLVATIILVIAGFSWHTRQNWLQNKIILGEVLVLAGALSNLFDRFFYGKVIDFILISYGTWSWPIFNVADMCIVIGLGVMGICGFMHEKLYDT